jgi:hypothetical protein
MTFDRARTSKPLPYSIKIGPTTYAVSEAEELVGPDGQPLFGEVCYRTARIRLLQGAPKASRPVTLVHEILHAILDSAGHDGAEAQIIALSHGLVDVLQANPGLASFLSEGE